MFFVFQDRKLKLSPSVRKRISRNVTKFQVNQTIYRKNENNNCLNELNEIKFWEVSRNSVSSRCYKYLEKQKSFIPEYAKIDPKDGVSRLNFQ